MKKHLPAVQSFHLMARRDAYEGVRIPRERTWYHGGEIEGELGTIYLTPTEALAETHAEATGGRVYEFRMSDQAVWGDISLSVGPFVGMDDIGYQPSMIRKAKESGADVLWDFDDYRAHPQILVVNPKVLELSDRSATMAARVARRHWRREHN